MLQSSLQEEIDRPGDEPSKAQLLDQVERIVASAHFKNSKRYPSFLRFVVERTLAHDTDVLKERNLGVEVFGRQSDYDTGADPIVRVTAGEVRKRIAQYYQTSGHEGELRIDLPLGSYVPHFYPSGRHPAAEPVQIDQTSFEEAPVLREIPKPLSATAAELISAKQEEANPAPSESVNRKRFRSKRYVFGALGATVLIIGMVAAFAFARTRFETSGTRFFWNAYTAASRPALIVIGVHFLDGPTRGLPADTRPAHNGLESALWSMESTDMVPVSDIVSYSKLTDLLTQRALPYRTKGSSETSLEDLRTGPVILIGGFNNLWTLRLTSPLRFRFVAESPTVNTIQDREHPESVWTFNNMQPAVANSTDYAVVASYYDASIEQHVLVAAGIGKSGTMAASEFLTTEKYMGHWLAQSKIGQNKNVELVLATEVLDGDPGPPHVVAYTTW